MRKYALFRSAGNRCKHAFLYVNELTDHITEFHGIAEVDVNKCVNDNQIQESALSNRVLYVLKWRVLLLDA